VISATEPLWRRATRCRRLGTNRTVRAIATLVLILRKAGEDVSFVEVRNWPRALQGDAYLWAIDKLSGTKNVRPPWTR
jgi:hypothetical protein